MINFMSTDNVFEDPGDGRGISGPLLQNEKVTVCCYSSFLCLLVPLTCGKSVSFINFMLLFLLLKDDYVAPEKLNLDLTNEQREKQREREKERKTRGQYFCLTLTDLSLSHLHWLWEVMIGILNMNIRIPFPSCACFCNSASNPKDWNFQQPIFFFAVEAIP